jgi:hypothetical protein
MVVSLSARILESFHGKGSQKPHGNWAKGSTVGVRKTPITPQQRDVGRKLKDMVTSKNPRAFARSETFDELRLKGLAFRSVTGRPRATKKGEATLKRYDDWKRNSDQAGKKVKKIYDDLDKAKAAA